MTKRINQEIGGKMNKEEIKEYLKRVEELELKLIDKDKETLQWLIYGYNQCAKLLNETKQENIQLKTQLLEKKCSDKDIEYKEKIKLQQRIDKAIDLLIIKKARYLNEDDYVLNVPDLDDILQVLKEVE